MIGFFWGGGWRGEKEGEVSSVVPLMGFFFLFFFLVVIVCLRLPRHSKVSALKIAMVTSP